MRDAFASGRLHRRSLLRLGAIGLGGLTLPGLLGLERSARAAPLKARARSVIVLFLSGGPAQQDMWDLKPEAPEEVRGTFRPIATNVGGIGVCEHLPRMARVADKYAIVRSLHHREADHPAAAYWMMIGSPIGRPKNQAGFMSRADRPHPGSVVAQRLGPSGGMPPFVLLPEAIQPNGPERSGQFAGFLGAAFDPYRVNSDPNLPEFSPGVLELPPELPARRLARRRALLDAVGADPADDYARALDLVSSPAAQRAFRIADEPDAVRDRYGRHVFGQSVLLARRLVEAGVRLVQVNWVRHDGGKGAQGYDTHRNHLALSKDELLPPTDAAFAALVDDLATRGLLDETLVIMTGEFGRTPRFNKDGGRDHWPNCFGAVLAGGGVRGGTVLGASDRLAAYPAADPVTPGDLIATLYHVLGIDPHATILDRQDRPYVLAEGEPLHALF